MTMEEIRKQLESTTVTTRRDGMLDAGSLHSVVPAHNPSLESLATLHSVVPAQGARGVDACREHDDERSERSDDEVRPARPAGDERSEDDLVLGPADSSSASAGAWRDAGETWADAGVTVGSKLEYWTELGLLLKRQQEAQSLADAAAALLEGPHLVRAALDLQRETAAAPASVCHTGLEPQPRPHTVCYSQPATHACAPCLGQGASAREQRKAKKARRKVGYIYGRDPRRDGQIYIYPRIPQTPGRGGERALSITPLAWEDSRHDPSGP